jgi:PAS domain S-box-containing protein
MNNLPADKNLQGADRQDEQVAKPIIDEKGGTREPLTIPDRLYGRDREMVALLESFERISSGRGEVLLVPGASGVGKTALVQELQRPIRERNGFFIRGKFDQYQQNIPYFAFRQALAELCRQMQSGNAHELARFKADIHEAVGNLGQVLVDLVSELGIFLGTQPPLEDIGPQEARHRFASVFRHFLRAVCRPEHPLVLFIDDWQWADAASCELLKQMQVGTTLRGLLVIVSYRDNEVDSGHPLMAAVDKLRNDAVPVVALQVENITVQDVRAILADTLKPSLADMEGLAAVIHGQSRGNPFFARSFLSYLHEIDLIWFDRERNCWQWRVDEVHRADLPDDVVGLFILKLRRLDDARRNLFSLAACLGNRFDMAMLSIISGRPIAECRALLGSPETKALLRPLKVGGGDFPTKDFQGTEEWMLVHDRVQQAAHSLIDPGELPSLRLKIGRLLLASLPPEQLAEKLFEVVGDLNAGSLFVKDTEEQLKFLELNLTAARKAYAATAYRAALGFYRAANRFLEMPGLAAHLGRDRDELRLQLFKERAGCEFLEGNLTEAEACVQKAVTHAGSAIEKAAALSILIVQYTLLARYPEAIAAGRQALAALGLSLPENDYEAARDEEIAQVREELRHRSVASLFELPVMSHPEMLTAAKILITMGPPCYRSHQRLWGVIVPRVVNLTLRHGNIPQVGYSHTAFGGLLGWVNNDYATARDFGDLATRLMSGTFRSPPDQSVFYLMIGSSIRHWFKHLRHGTQDYKDAYEIGLRSGNLQYAAYAFGHDMYCRFYQGVPLAGLIQESRRSLAFSRTRHNQWAIDLLEGGLNVFSNLAGEPPEANGNVAWSEAEYLQRVESHQNIQVTCIYKVLKTFFLLVSGRHEEALALSDETEPLIYTVGTQGLLPWAEHVFARVLILTELFPNAGQQRQAHWRAELDRMLVQLRNWAEHCPENFEHKYLLAAAELARIDNRPGAAMELYDQAVEAAQAGEFQQWEGLANERAHGFWLGRGNERLAQVYWQQAYVCFGRWGATAKVRSLETAYRALVSKNLPAEFDSVEPSEKLEPKIAAALVDRQIKQVRHYAFQMQQSTLRAEAATQADELAQAMQRVRVEIAERKRAQAELETVHKQLMDASRRAGMAEVAASVLHNVGNVLNSVNVSATLITTAIRTSKVANLPKVVALLREHETDLAAFLSGDPKGKQLPRYLDQLAGHLAGEQAAALTELDGLQTNIEHINDIVALHQNYAQVSDPTEKLQMIDLVEQSLHLNTGTQGESFPAGPDQAKSPHEEIPALIETLLATEQRLEELTDGEVNTAAGRDARTLLLRRAQDGLRFREAARQEAGLNELRAIFDMVPAMIWLKDTEDRILRVNQRVADMAGKSIEEIEGTPASENYPQETARHYEDDLEVIHSGVSKTGIIEKLRGPKGQELWVKIDKVPVLDKDGTVTGLVVMAQDISKRRRDEESLRASQANMAAAQRLAHFGSWESELTTSKNVDTNALHWSDEMFRIAGYEPGAVEVSRDLFFRLVHPDDREPVRQAVETAIRERREYSIVHRLIRADGETRVVQETGQIVFDETTGQPAKIVGTAHDITERKRSEAELDRAHQELVKASRQAGMAEFATGVLHNVSNVLNSVNVATTCLAGSLKKSKSANLAKVVALMRQHEADLGNFLAHDPQGMQVIGFLAQLADHLAGEQAAALKELGEVQVNIEHIKHIITTQQDSARATRLREVLNLPNLAEECLKMNANGLQRSGIQVIKEFEEIPSIMTEKHLVLQILVNLMRNAIQACELSGSPEKRLTIRISQGANGVRIAVADNGSGILPEHLPRIFAHGFTTKKEGHGFGLHSAAMAAKEMGGSLTAHSDGSGRGATFTLELPYAPNRA